MKKKIRIDTSGTDSQLSHNPFESLRPVSPSTDAQAPVPPQPAPAETARFSVARTKKGGYALAIERRNSGKMVTILSNVTGDVEALCALLRKRCAAGGTVVDGNRIEIQGNHVTDIEDFLRQRKC